MSFSRSEPRRRNTAPVRDGLTSQAGPSATRDAVDQQRAPDAKHRNGSSSSSSSLSGWFGKRFKRQRSSGSDTPPRPVISWPLTGDRLFPTETPLGSPVPIENYCERLPNTPRYFPDRVELAPITEKSNSSKTSSLETKPTMDYSRLAPGPIDGTKRQKAMQDAKDMFQSVLRTCERTNSQMPPYEFIELIGKGSYGRVYKCKEQETGDLVAIKIVNTDDLDYQQNFLDKDDTIRDFRKEVTILQQLKDSRAKNINMIHEAFALQQQLWIVCDYCTGGSVRTLMRASPPSHPGLEERFIVPIARELALAIKSVHDIGVIHRDVKCTNVYVTEKGDIQLGDFGIVGVMDNGVSKRKTIVGTPHYMPVEMHTSIQGNETQDGYGTEVDIWSFGCSVYEMATGLPPNARVGPDRVGTVIINNSAPRLEGGDHSQELRDFIAFCLNSDPKARPTAEEVLKHPYIASSQKRYPTSSLTNLIDRYKVWERSGGIRQSLFGPHGAPPVAGFDNASESEELDDWNFSTSDSFNEAFEKRYSQMMTIQDVDDLAFDAPHGAGLPPIITKDLTPLERMREAQKELSANRGERSLERLWNADTAPYEMHTEDYTMPDPSFSDDLSIRKYNPESAPIRESLIDLDSAGAMESAPPTFNFDFGDIPTLKARSSKAPTHEDEEEDEYQYGDSEADHDKRATMEWKFPAAKRATMDWTFPKSDLPALNEPSGMDLPPPGDGNPSSAFRPKLKHTATVPLGEFGDFIHPTQKLFQQPPTPVRDSTASMIDLDMSLADPADLDRPSTANSAAGSTMTDMTSGNPFDLEDDPEQNEVDRNRFSYHKQWQSEGGQVKRSSIRDSVPMHTRGNSLSSTESDMDRPSTAESGVFNLTYNRQLSEPMRQLLNGTLTPETPDIDLWPNFATDDFSKVQPFTDDLSDTSAGPGHPRPSNGHAVSFAQPRELAGIRTGKPRIDFPHLLAPHPQALQETAAHGLVVGELNRLLDGFSEGMRATAQAMAAQSGLEAEDGPDESESGFGETGAEEA